MSMNLAPLPNHLQLGEYLIERMLVRGGFGFTYLAVSLSDWQRVVIKENYPCLGCTRLPGQYAFVKQDRRRAAAKGGEEWSARNFRNEVAALRMLNHPCVPRVLDDFYVPETGTSYYVMPHYSGGTLLETVASAGTSRPEGVLYLAAALMSALSHIHGAGLLHRDIKPENVVFTAEGVPVLLDFGAARLSESERLTRVISKEYSPQEQVKGDKQGPWTDIYALGATLYFAITGTHVPASSSRSKELDPYVPLAGHRKFARMYEARFLESVDKALSPEPGERFASVQQWKAVLQGIPGFQMKYPERLTAEFPLEESVDRATVLAQTAGSPSLVVESFSMDPGMAEGNEPGRAGRSRTKKVMLSVLLVTVLLALAAVATVLLLPGKNGKSALEMAFATPAQLCAWGDADSDPVKAVELYRTAAEKGYAEAQYHLGACYEKGKGVPKNAEEALTWYQKAAEKGYAEAQYHLGVCYEKGKGTTRDLSKAEQWLKKAAENHYPGAEMAHQEVVAIIREEKNAAQLEKARELLTGEKYAMALELLLQLAEQEYAEAQLLLGECYFTGNGVEKNIEEAEKWFSKAVTHGNKMADEGLKKIAAERERAEMAAQLQEARKLQEKKEYSRAVELLQPLAEQGNEEAEKLLTQCRELEAAGEREKTAAILKEAQILCDRKEYAKEMELLRPLAEKGNVEAQMHLGNRYLNGMGVAEDVNQALFWYRKAAEQGYTYVQYMIGAFYYQGLYGLKADVDEAVHWIRQAAEGGYAEAQLALANFYFGGEGVPENCQEGEKWLTLAANQGNTEAQQQLGIRYMVGKDLPRNEDSAMVWLRVAAEKGDVVSQSHLGMLCFNRGELDEALNWFNLAAEQGYLDAMYMQGVYYYYKRGGKQDKKKAISIWEKAAAAGSEVSRRELKKIKNGR